MEHLFEHGYLAVNPVEKLFWRAVHGLGSRATPPLTPFATMEALS
jgi:hypothetical protein